MIDHEWEPKGEGGLFRCVRCGLGVRCDDAPFRLEAELGLFAMHHDKAVRVAFVTSDCDLELVKRIMES